MLFLFLRYYKYTHVGPTALVPYAHVGTFCLVSRLIVAIKKKKKRKKKKGRRIKEKRRMSLDRN